MDEFKLSGLLFALLFLFEKLFYEPVPRRVSTDLLNLRRAFAFGEVDSDTAKYELKKLLGRLNPAEFVEGLCWRTPAKIALLKFSSVRNRIISSSSDRDHFCERAKSRGSDDSDY